MELELVCVGRDGVRRAVVVDVEPDEPVAHLARSLGCREALYLGAVALPGWLPVHRTDVVHGCVLGIDAPPPVPVGSAVGGGSREVAVVGGLHGGPRTTLYPVGVMTVGRAAEADLVLVDAEVSRRHARLVISAVDDRVRVEDVGSHNGVRWRGQVIAEPVDLASGDVVELGETVIGVREVVTADAELTREPGTRVFHRPTGRAAPTADSPERSARSRDPDPSWLIGAACAPSSRLWERRAGDPDFLRLRLGLHDRPAEPRMPFADPPPVLRAVPVGVDLADVGVLGLAGPRGALLASARATLARAAVLCPPDELAIVLVTGPENAAAWDWLTWLPHTRPRSAVFDCARLVATDDTQARARLGELRELPATRHGRPPSWTLVVLDGVRRLSGLSGLTEVLTGGPAGGVVTLCLEEDPDALPPSCGAVLAASGDTGGRAVLRCRDQPAVTDVLVDGVPVEHATRLALALASIRLPGDAPVHRTAPGPRVRPRLITELGRSTGTTWVEVDSTVPVGTAVVASERPGADMTGVHLSRPAGGGTDR
ncbi:FHA domain-containing protein [Actinosynnema sp. NPDC050801]|uniref:FHA domain-containing protein n=1 Tax=unclassified Actinosynnema TaxID=2637065 RepID=UPI0033E57D14